jgi:hypothetical protein
MTVRLKSEEAAGLRTVANSYPKLRRARFTSPPGSTPGTIESAQRTELRLLARILRAYYRTAPASYA